MFHEHIKSSCIFYYLSSKLDVTVRASLLIAIQMFFIFTQYCINFI